MRGNILAFTKSIGLMLKLKSECKGKTSVELIIKNEVEEFAAFLSLLDEVKIVVIDAPEDSLILHELILKIQDRRKKIKNLLVLSDEKLDQDGMIVYRRNEVQALLQKLKTIIEIPKRPEFEKFISIPVESIAHFRMVTFDLYIKLTEERYVKRIPAMEDIDEALIVSLQSKGIIELYFRKKHRRDFSIMLINNMINKVESSYVCEKKKAKITNGVLLTTNQIIREVGLPAKVIEVCESVMDSIYLDVTRTKDKFSNYLSSIRKSPDLSFQFRFVHLTCYIGTQMVEFLDSTNEEELIRKIVFSAFFCDIALGQPELIEIRNLDVAKDLWPEERKVLSGHALKASEIISKYKKAPPGVDLIIKQHHGSLSGKDLPKVCHTGVEPLAICLMASQELAFALIKRKNKDPIEVILHLLNHSEGTPLYEFLFKFYNKSRSELKAA